MVTLAEPGTRQSLSTGTLRAFVVLAAFCLTVAVVGFAPTYWIPLLRGSLDASFALHLHAVLFHGWLVLFVTQAWLASTGRLDRHRRMGLVGIAMATAMLFVGVEVAVARLEILAAGGAEAAARAFSVVPLTGIVLFAGMVAVAVANAARRPEVHMRVMLAANVGVLNAAMGRLVRLFAAPEGAGPPPVAFSILPGLMGDLILVGAMIHDRRTRGRVHPAYWVAGAVLLASQLIRVPLSRTEAWLAFTRWLVP
jgi:hypothetical protein